MDSRSFTVSHNAILNQPPPIAAKPKLRSKSTSSPVKNTTTVMYRSENNTSPSMDSISSCNHSDSGFLDHIREELDSTTMPTLPPNGGDCPKHPHERLKYYCQLHDELVCADCLAMEVRHQGHKHTRADDLADEYRTSLNAQLQPLHELHQNAQTALKTMATRRKELITNGEDVKGVIKGGIGKLVSILESREQELLEEAEQITTQKIKHHDAHKAYLEGLMTELSKVVDSVAQAANENSNNILYHHKQLSEWVLDATRKFQSLPSEVFVPLQGANMSFMMDPAALEACQRIGSVSERQADPSRCFIHESTTKGLTVSEETMIQLAIYDSDGRPYYNHVKGIKVEVISTASNASLDVKLDQHKSIKNLYNILFTPFEGCEHVLRVKIGSSPVQNSPLVFKVGTIINGEMVGEIKGLLQPYGIAVTDQSEVVIVENGKDCVSVFRKDGKNLRSISGKGNKKLNRPRGVALLPGHFLLISDEDGLKQCTMEGKHVTPIGCQGSGPLEFNTPCGLIVGIDGRIFVCDTFNGRIQVLNPDLSFNSFMGTDIAPPGKLNAPYDIAINSAGMFYIADYSDHMVKIFSSRGDHLGQITSKGSQELLKNPVSVHVNKNDHVFVGEEKATGVSVFDMNGKFLMTVPVRLSGSYGITSDYDGLLYISDRANRRVQIFT